MRPFGQCFMRVLHQIGTLASMNVRFALLAASAFLVSACAAPDAPVGSAAAAPASAAARSDDRTPSGRLHRLFHYSDEASLRRNPLSAMFRGDYRYADRLGDFFTDALPVCDAYVLMEVIHDWADAEAAAILKAVRAAAPPNATLLLVEDIVPETPGPNWARTLDIVMLAVTGGLQRTAREYAALLAECGFRMERVIDTPTGISIVEARSA